MCRICFSTSHFTSRKGENCPESYKNLQGTYQTDAEQKVPNCGELQDVHAVGDASDECHLDRYCTFNVIGQSQKGRFFRNFSIEDLQQVRVKETSTRYRFGREPSISPAEQIVFPCYLLGKRAALTDDVVPRNIPFLILKAEIKQRGFRDFDTDRLTVNGPRNDTQWSFQPLSLEAGRS